MLELLYDEVSSTIYDLGIAAPIWLLALIIPFRHLSARVEVGWDVVGYVGTIVFSWPIVLGLEDPFLDWIMPRLDFWYESYNRLPLWTALLLYVVVSDFASYWAHRLLHGRLLWDTHAWHHSPKYLYVLSGSRAGPIHILVLIAPTTLAYLVFPYPTAHYYALAHGAFQVANQHYIHSNLWVPFAKYLEFVLVTPRFHFVHHSRTRAYCDSNYGFIFSVWDRLFGTYTDPDRVPRDEPLGLNYEISNVRALFGLPPPRRPASGASGSAQAANEAA
jgi:sterol desaturase/sphingolipid hydroxylase (fatty acid hydroxylase superfamily)